MTDRTSGSASLRAPGPVSREPGVRAPAHGGRLYAHERATLLYRFTGEKEVDLMSTYVPESFRGQGVAALLSKAAMDFLVEENLKAHVSCWYIKKYIEDNPLLGYKDLIIT
ncbi:protein NATD1-like isoform X2 [Thunnus thynnus]|uniref:protein NATD1-like isoform X2 n=1 Tax=Thunnus thynnus TaxID=8237 RepID=UPI0035286036